MNGQDIKNSIHQLAIQGKLVEQREQEGSAKELLEQILAEKKQLTKEGKIKNTKALPEITEDVIPFDIPESWEWVRLADVSQNIHYGYTASAKEVGNCKLLRITDIQNNSVDWGSVPFCNVKEKDYVTYGLNNRDIMIARTGGTIGKTYIVESLKDRVVFASYLIRVVPVESIDENYLKKFMESPLYWLQLKAGSMGTGQPNVNGTTLSRLVLPLPPLQEQKRIVEKIEELMPFVEKYDKAYSEVVELNKKFPEDMQKSILQYAIKGKLVEQRKEEGTAEELYQQIQEEKKKLIKEGKIKKTNSLLEISEDEIPFDIPETWKWVRLGDVFDILMGQSPKGTSVFEGSDGMEFHQGKVFFGDDYLKVSNQSTDKPTKVVEPHTVLLCVRAPVGIVNITERKICIGRGLCGINTFVGMDAKFVMHTLRAFMNDFIKKATGTTFVAITGEVVKNQLYPLPPLEEQKRIVKKIEELLPYTKQLVK